MKSITLQYLQLEHFKCHERLRLDFHGKNCRVAGDNAAGKTSLYDGLCWLLYGRDSAGNGEKVISIKPLNPDGTVKDHRCLTAVEAGLQVNGLGLTLRRTLREVWVSRPGGERVFQGHTSQFFVDGAPCRKAAFDRKIRSLAPESVFRLLTSVSCFPLELSWQERRALLFDIAGTQTDEELLASREVFRPLKEHLEGLTPEEYRAKLLSRKKELTQLREDIPVRLNECAQRAEELRTADFSRIREDMDGLQRRLEEAAGQLLTLDQDAAVQSRKLQIREAELDLKELDRKNRAYRERQAWDAGDPQSLALALKEQKKRLSTLEGERQDLRRELEAGAAQLKDAWARWEQANARGFSGGVCPSCGQELPPALLQKAREGFEQEQARTLGRLREQRQALQDRLARLRERLGELDGQLPQLQAQLEHLEARKAALPEIQDLPGLEEERARGEARLQGARRALEELMTDRSRARAALVRERDQLAQQLDQLRQSLAREQMLTQLKNRMEQLRGQEQDASRALREVEAQLLLLTEFARYKADLAQTQVNRRFRIAAFRLFREQVDGGLEQRCDVVCQGIPYLDLNNGARVNVGIDIINTLTRHFGVSIPLFLDNAEAVTALEPCLSQTIRLEVRPGLAGLRLDAEA